MHMRSWAATHRDMDQISALRPLVEGRRDEDLTAVHMNPGSGLTTVRHKE